MGHYGPFCQLACPCMRHPTSPVILLGGRVTHLLALLHHIHVLQPFSHFQKFKSVQGMCVKRDSIPLHRPFCWGDVSCNLQNPLYVYYSPSTCSCYYCKNPKLVDSTLKIPYKNLKTWWLCGCSTFAIPTQLYIIGFASTYLKKLRVERDGSHVGCWFVQPCGPQQRSTTYMWSWTNIWIVACNN